MTATCCTGGQFTNVIDTGLIALLYVGTTIRATTSTSRWSPQDSAGTADEAPTRGHRGPSNGPPTDRRPQARTLGRAVHIDDHVPVDITELLDRAAHDAMRVYPELDVALVPAPTMIIVGLPAGLRLAVDNAIANAVKHRNTTRVQLSAVSSRAGVWR
jgi:hypothetical protein